MAKTAFHVLKASFNAVERSAHVTELLKYKIFDVIGQIGFLSVSTTSENRVSAAIV